MTGDLAAAKAAARAAAFARRAAAHAAGHPDPSGLLAERLAMAVRRVGGPVAGYVAMRTEIDPAPALARVAGAGLAFPVMADGLGHPLRFRSWAPGGAMADGGFGTLVPAAGDWVTPRVVVVPLVAFDRRGGRLGYGGGFYDRTLPLLRAGGPLVAIGFAWAAQEDAGLPLEPTDAPLDLLVTEAEVLGPFA